MSHLVPSAIPNSQVPFRLQGDVSSISHSIPGPLSFQLGSDSKIPIRVYNGGIRNAHSIHRGMNTQDSETNGMHATTLATTPMAHQQDPIRFEKENGTGTCLMIRDAGSQASKIPGSVYTAYTRHPSGIHHAMGISEFNHFLRSEAGKRAYNNELHATDSLLAAWKQYGVRLPADLSGFGSGGGVMAVAITRVAESYYMWHRAGEGDYTGFIFIRMPNRLLDRDTYVNEINGTSRRQYNRFEHETPSTEEPGGIETAVRNRKRKLAIEDNLGPFNLYQPPRIYDLDQARVDRFLNDLQESTAILSRTREEKRRFIRETTTWQMVPWSGRTRLEPMPEQYNTESTTGQYYPLGQLMHFKDGDPEVRNIFQLQHEFCHPPDDTTTYLDNAQRLPKVQIRLQGH